MKTDSSRQLQRAQRSGGHWRLGAGGPVDTGVWSALVDEVGQHVVGRRGQPDLLSAGLLEGVMEWEERV